MSEKSEKPETDENQSPQPGTKEEITAILREGIVKMLDAEEGTRLLQCRDIAIELLRKNAEDRENNKDLREWEQASITKLRKMVWEEAPSNTISVGDVAVLLLSFLQTAALMLGGEPETSANIFAAMLLELSRGMTAAGLKAPEGEDGIFLDLSGLDKESG
jgi:hypothetical protein